MWDLHRARSNARGGELDKQKDQNGRGCSGASGARGEVPGAELKPGDHHRPHPAPRSSDTRDGAAASRAEACVRPAARREGKPVVTQEAQPHNATSKPGSRGRPYSYCGLAIELLHCAGAQRTGPRRAAAAALRSGLPLTASCQRGPHQGGFRSACATQRSRALLLSRHPALCSRPFIHHHPAGDNASGKTAQGATRPHGRLPPNQAAPRALPHLAGRRPPEMAGETAAGRGRACAVLRNASPVGFLGNARSSRGAAGAPCSSALSGLPGPAPTAVLLRSLRTAD